MGAAISKRTRELVAREFGEMLDVYDKDYKPLLSSIAVPRPVAMVEKLNPQKKKNTGKTAQKEKTTEKEPGLRECCHFLNDLIRQLPQTRYA